MVVKMMDVPHQELSVRGIGCDAALLVCCQIMSCVPVSDVHSDCSLCYLCAKRQDTDTQAAS